METKKNIKNIPKFYCEKCDFKCSLKSDMDRHYLRPKHLTNVDGNNWKEKKHKKTYTCLCSKKYTTHSGLWKHQNKCDNYINNKICNNENIVTNNSSCIDNNDLKQIVLNIVKSNHELQKQNELLNCKPITGISGFMECEKTPVITVDTPVATPLDTQMDTQMDTQIVTD